MALNSSRRRDMLQLAAARQSRERQQGVDCSQGYLESTDDRILFDGPRTLECFFKYIPDSSPQFPIALSTSMMCFELSPSNVIRFFCGTSSLETPIVPNQDYHATISYDGSTAQVYLNGTLVGTITPKAYAVASSFRIGHVSYPPKGPVYFARIYNYAISAEDAATLYNNGDPAEYILPYWYKFKGPSYQSSPSIGTDGWEAVSESCSVGMDSDTLVVTIVNSNRATIRCRMGGSYKPDHAGAYFAIVEMENPLTQGWMSLYPFTGAYGGTLVHRGDGLYSGIITPPKDSGQAAMSHIAYDRQPVGTVIRIKSISITPIGCVAEYLPQNLVPAGPGERTPVEITENKTYTWTGVDDTTYSIRVGTSRNPVLGQWYLIKGTVSNYEAGTPYISADTGYTEFALPRGNDEFSVFAQCRSTGPSSYFFTFIGGNRNTDRRLTVTIESIEPINNIASTWLDSAKQLPLNDEYLPPLLETAGGYDLAANRTPGIVYPESSLWYGVEYDVTQKSPSCVRIGDMSLHQQLPIQSRMRGCLLDDNGKVIEYLGFSDWTGQTRDGSRGQVMVELPMHYRKFETDGTKRRVRISEYPLPGYHLVGKRYVSAYQATIQRSTTILCSVVNMDADYRGGGNNTAYDGTYRTLLGRPATTTSRINFRNYARKRKAGSTEWNCMTYDIQKELYWLFVIEYATLNSQAAFNAEKDSNGYAQGGLGAGVTNMSDWSGFNGYYPFVPCGHTDELGNGTGEVAYPVINEDGSTRCTVMVPRYRGVENPFGHIWQWTDGINVRISPTEENSGDGLSKVFVCADPAKFSDSGYDGYAHVGNEARTEAYVKEVIFGEGGEIIPSVVGGGSSTYFCDGHYTGIPSSETVLRGVMFGGPATSGASAGFASAGSSYSPSYTHTYIGSRLCFIPKK